MTKPSTSLARHWRQVRAILDHAGMANLRVFGSVARRDDVSGSDVDIVVDALAMTTLYDLADIEIAIERLLGCKVEVLTADFMAPDVALRAERDMVPLDSFEQIA